MFQPGSLIVYGSTGVCRVEDVGPKKIMKDILKTCYTLTPLYSRETITVPVDSPVIMREVISREQAEQLIDRIPEEEPAAVPGRKSRPISPTGWKRQNHKETGRPGIGTALPFFLNFRRRS